MSRGKFLLMGIFFAAIVAGATSSIAADDYVIQLGYYDCDHMCAAPIARDAGIFRDLGLKVNITKGSNVLPAISAGKMDVGYGNYISLARAHLKGSPAFVAAHNHTGGAFYLVMANSFKGKPKDLMGKRLALGMAPEETLPWWHDYAKANSIPVKADGYQNFIMKDQDEYLAIKTGKLDGALMCDPWGSMIEYEKIGHIMHTFDPLPGDKEGICCVYSMSKEFSVKHPDLAVKMLLAHSRALQLVYTHPLKSARIFAASYSVPLEVALMTIYKKTNSEGRTMTWDIHRKGFENQTRHYVDIGYLTAMPDMKRLVNPEIYDKAKPLDFARFIKEKVDPVFPLGMSYADWKKKVMARGL
ncbi:MAG TPA: periplasmic-binding protein-like II family lipoprotein [Syntrophorhabdus aromaticivorans]|nr:periplasmic-binding protein-like II family lipoprotein [Syntrophorhabdus aromaticivorans]